jgi:hypothetical protein
MLDQIKFKPFLQETDKPLKGRLCVIDIYENYLETYDSYTFEELQDDETYKPRKVFSVTTYRKSQIKELSFYWQDHQNGYFLDINENCWGFVDEAEGLEVYSRIKEWLCK